jgi:hypothetical protein
LLQHTSGGGVLQARLPAPEAVKQPPEERATRQMGKVACVDCGARLIRHSLRRHRERFHA